MKVKLYRHINIGPYTVTDFVAEANRGTAGQRKATVYQGIRVTIPDAAPVWIAATAFRGLYNLKKESLPKYAALCDSREEGAKSKRSKR